MRVILLFTLSWCLAWTVGAEGNPKIVCAAAAWDFGVQNSSETAKHVFVIENQGDGPLSIGTIRSCCGSTATIQSKALAPGESTELHFELELKRRKGIQQKNVFIASNDPKTPYLQLKVSGEVRDAYSISKSYLYWPDLNLIHGKSETVTFGWQDADYQIIEVKAEDSWLSVSSQTQENGEVQITVKSGQGMKDGRNSSRVVILTNHPDFPKINIPVTALVKKDVVIQPQQIVLAPFPPQREITRYVMIRSKSYQQFTLKDVKAPEESGVSCEVIKKSPFQWLCKVTIDTEVFSENAILELETDIANLERIPVPVEFKR